MESVEKSYLDLKLKAKYYCLLQQYNSSQKYDIDLSNRQTISKLVYMMIHNFPLYYIQEYIINHPDEINSQDSDGYTALMIAIFCKKIKHRDKLVEMLLCYGANPNLQQHEKETALTYAAKHSRNLKTNNIIKILLEKGTDPNLRNRHGETALMLAAKYSNLTSTEATVKILLQNGADPNLKDNKGQTALLSVINNNTNNIVELLLEYGADISITDKNGDNVLVYAGKHNRISIVKMLMKHEMIQKEKIKDAPVIDDNIFLNSKVIESSASVNKQPSKFKFFKKLFSTDKSNIIIYNANDCSICMNNKVDISIIGCGHCFCNKCIIEVDKCPNCRKQFSPENLQTIYL